MVAKYFSLAMILSCAFCASRVSAQTPTLAQAIQYRETIKTEITNALLYVDAWEKILKVGARSKNLSFWHFLQTCDLSEV